MQLETAVLPIILLLQGQQNPQDLGGHNNVPAELAEVCKPGQVELARPGSRGFYAMLCISRSSALFGGRSFSGGR